MLLVHTKVCTTMLYKHVHLFEATFVQQHSNTLAGCICGLMMMASFVDDREQIRREMLTAADFFDEVKMKYFADDEAFCERSWGMSDDYLIALECRTTMVRIGTSIFGPRVY